MLQMHGSFERRKKTQILIKNVGEIYIVCIHTTVRHRSDNVVKHGCSCSCEPLTIVHSGPHAPRMLKAFVRNVSVPGYSLSHQPVSFSVATVLDYIYVCSLTTILKTYFG